MQKSSFLLTWELAGLACRRRQLQRQHFALAHSLCLGLDVLANQRDLRGVHQRLSRIPVVERHHTGRSIISIEGHLLQGQVSAQVYPYHAQVANSHYSQLLPPPQLPPRPPAHADDPAAPAPPVAPPQSGPPPPTPRPSRPAYRPSSSGTALCPPGSRRSCKIHHL